MDALTYMKERERMCHAINRGRTDDDFCLECPLGGLEQDCTGLEREKPEKAIAIVEKWSAEHPVMTNAQKFEEVFGWKIDRYFDKLPAAWWDEPYVEPKEAEE